MSTQTVLVVAAHPDDEVLGCGGTMARHATDGDWVGAMFLADGVSSRTGAEPTQCLLLEQREAAAQAAASLLGAQQSRFFRLPDNRLDSVPLLDLVRTIESVIAEVRPDIVYTHHGGDLNIDHALVHRAVVTACRPVPSCGVRAIYAFETPSSTEWSSAAIGEAFRPTRFADISAHLDSKIAALNCYGTEMPQFPHPRSTQAVMALAALRGATAGVHAAEAFQIVREVW